MLRRKSSKSDEAAAARGSPDARRGRKGRATIVVDPHLREAYDLLSRATEAGPRIHVEDLGELIYLVLRQTYSKDRLNAMLRVVDPVHDLAHLDDKQCQRVPAPPSPPSPAAATVGRRRYVINKIKNQSRANTRPRGAGRSSCCHFNVRPDRERPREKKSRPTQARGGDGRRRQARPGARRVRVRGLLHVQQRRRRELPRERGPAVRDALHSLRC